MWLYFGEVDPYNYISSYVQIETCDYRSECDSRFIPLAKTINKKIMWNCCGNESVADVWYGKSYTEQTDSQNVYIYILKLKQQ